MSLTPLPPAATQQSLDGSASGGRFTSDTCPSRPAPQYRKFASYGEWFEAGRKKPHQVARTESGTAKPTSFWPYGTRVTTLTNSAEEGVYYNFDHRLVKDVVPHKPEVQLAHSVPLVPASALPMQHSGSAPHLFGSHFENQTHFRRTNPQIYTLKKPSNADERANREAPKFLDKVGGKTPAASFTTSKR
mmetsp:Transcript_72611/g.151580  ORF Transcript_72611/g.151580 Transcript_72611/m.151580 type:complete len:189 (-) Transcript_72611:49-615(-)|eukprot:CAMPEP_0206531330 /NCGR_PEP_ID=MMETSP0325_2-20121206/3697_1 /ASSEMBLY_ACC=CAM_ASM_000347 /TAXON_ID=2866 /ORGANISM="Crypthecodinium cohnii, Strain Seligo" /LENGTH=188 /DNA_ID=CAMNT_0054027545 /DNA_START=69 /DNA_END=635 /DNA_ORIENTATION=-